VREPSDNIVDDGFITTKQVSIEYGFPVIVVFDEFILEEVDESPLIP
jgi:hypothetical protein